MSQTQAPQPPSQRESQLGRIRALMAKTEANGCTEAEARSAAEAVDRLLAAYDLSLSDLEVRRTECILRIVEGTRNHDVVFCSKAIARFTDTKTWRRGRQVVFFGFATDVEIAEYLCLIFKRSIDKAALLYAFEPSVMAAPCAEQQLLVRSFGLGLIERLKERLDELKSKRDFSLRESTGRSLVAVKAPVVAAAFAALGLEMRRTRAASEYLDAGAFQAGREGANSIALNQGLGAKKAPLSLAATP